MFLVITLSKDGFLSVVFKNALAKSDVVMIPTRLFCSYTSNLVLVEIIVLGLYQSVFEVTLW